MIKNEIEIRECLTTDELADCVRLQREVFNMPEIEISPVRHFVVTRHAGGFTLGAFSGSKLVGFVLSFLAYKGNQKIFYSHMTGIDKNYQNYGIGSRLKWAQRKRALDEGANFIKWTFQPVQARNAFFNLRKLGAIVREYHPNFYGTDFDAAGEIGVESDRLFAEWNLESERVSTLAGNGIFEDGREVVATVTIPNNWNNLLRKDPLRAIEEQNRIRKEFQRAFSRNLHAVGFERSETEPKFLLVSPE